MRANGENDVSIVEYVRTSGDGGTLPDMATAAQALAARSLRRTTFQAEKPTLEIVMTVSADGNAMTVTTRAPGSADEPSVFVYEKQG